MTQLLLFNQRWARRRESRRPPGEPIDPSRYGVGPVEASIARQFVTTHHYEGSYPAARCAIGLFEVGAGLVGTAVFSTPAGNRVLPKYFGLTPATELGRFVLLDHVPGNGETWFLKRAFAELQLLKPEVRGVLSFSDPVPRFIEGVETMPGHVGTIYQAHNAQYHGRTGADTFHMDSGGRILQPRSLGKIRRGERGAAGAYEDLVRRGAPRLRRGEAPADWLRRALKAGPFRRFRHPGKHAYTWMLRRPKHQANHWDYPKGVDQPRERT